MLAGQGIRGGSSLIIVTVKEHIVVLPEASVAVQVTGVVPIGKKDPDAGEQTDVTPGQLSETTGAG